MGIKKEAHRASFLMHNECKKAIETALIKRGASNALNSHLRHPFSYYGTLILDFIGFGIHFKVILISFVSALQSSCIAVKSETAVRDFYNASADIRAVV